MGFVRRGRFLRRLSKSTQVKAAFLYNFAKFVEWPPHVFKTPADPIVICVLGQNPFGNALEDSVNGKTVDGEEIPGASALR